MQARDLSENLPTVTIDDSVTEVVKLLTTGRLPGLIVVDRTGRPCAILPGTQVLRMAVPRAYQDDPALTRVVDEAHADVFWQESANATVAQCLPHQPSRPPMVYPDATVLEVAALMARARSPLVAIIDKKGEMIGGITLTRLLDKMAQHAA